MDLSEYLHNRINVLDRRLKLIENNSAPTIPFYDLTSPAGGTPGGGLCASDLKAIGAFAQGDSDTATCVLTVDRNVGCDGLVGIIAAAQTTGPDEGSILLEVDDSHGRRLTGFSDIGSSILEAEIGTGIEMTMAIYSITAGAYSPGDTITLTFDDVGFDGFITSGMAFAITGLPAIVGKEFASNGTTYPTDEALGDLLWLDSFGLPVADMTISTLAAVLTGVASINGGGYTPAQGAMLAERTNGSLYLAASLIPLVSLGDEFEPGGTLSSALGSGVANYAYINLA